MKDVPITHPEKIMFPDDGITKGELADYYRMVVPVMLPHLVGRPVTQERFHRGIGAKGFFQKNTQKGAPVWLERVSVPKKDGIVNYPVIRDERGLMWLANQNCITPHVWTSRVPDLDHPDVCVFDLDPLVENESALRKATILVRDFLAELGCRSWVKTSGSKGFHIVIPLAEGTSARAATRFASHVGRELVRKDPENLTQEFHKVDRAGRIYLDTGRNEPGATFAAAYAVRPKPSAPVSAPCTWEEIEQGHVNPRSLTLRAMKQRLESVGDIWGDMHLDAQKLPAL